MGEKKSRRLQIYGSFKWIRRPHKHTNTHHTSLSATLGIGDKHQPAQNTRITSCVLHAHVSFYMIKSAAGSTVTPVRAGEIRVKVAKLLIAHFKRGEEQRAFTVEF